MLCLVLLSVEMGPGEASSSDLGRCPAKGKRGEGQRGDKCIILKEQPAICQRDRSKPIATSA
jgi:hypothetical protein